MLPPWGVIKCGDRPAHAWSRLSWGSPRRGVEAADLAVVQAVVAEGEDLAGDRDAGDFGAAASSDPLGLPRSGPPPVGVFCAASISAQSNRCDPCLVIRPSRALPSSCGRSGSARPTRTGDGRSGRRRMSPSLVDGRTLRCTVAVVSGHRETSHVGFANELGVTAALPRARLTCGPVSGTMCSEIGRRSSWKRTGPPSPASPHRDALGLGASWPATGFSGPRALARRQREARRPTR